MESELNRQMFVHLSKDVATYYQTPATAEPTAFGPAVDSAFPSARMDIIEAGKCIGCGLNNAAVYHLMCIAEIGLRTLAWDRRVIVLSRNKKPMPLELAQWGELIRQIGEEIKAIGQWKASLVREEAHQFYNAAIIEARAFNDGYRRHVMHARTSPYGAEETVALWGHVFRFMQTLSKKISENTRTPNVWKRSG